LLLQTQELIINTILNSDRDQNNVFNTTEIRLLAIKLKNKHGIVFDHEKFFKHLKQSNTLSGLTRQVRNLGKVKDENAIMKLADGDLKSLLKLGDSDLRKSSSVIRLSVLGLRT